MKDRRIRVVNAAAVHVEERCVHKPGEDCCQRISCRDLPHGDTILPACCRSNFLPSKSSKWGDRFDRSSNNGYALMAMTLELSPTTIQDRKPKVPIKTWKGGLRPPRLSTFFSSVMVTSFATSRQTPIE